MTTELEIGLYIFILAGFLGYHVITRVPPLLHTPLMSATNAISGISLIGSLIMAGSTTESRWYATGLGFLAVVCSSTNVFGGFLITDRMLKMFKSERHGGQKRFPIVEVLIVVMLLLVIAILTILWWTGHLQGEETKHVLTYLYILSAILFILGLKGLSSPKWARQGMFLAETGMAVAIVGTLFHP